MFLRIPNNYFLKYPGPWSCLSFLAPLPPFSGWGGGGRRGKLLFYIQRLISTGFPVRNEAFFYIYSAPVYARVSGGEE
jgi:hypothetical protein